MRISVAFCLWLALGCAGAQPRDLAAVDCIQPRPWLTPLDVMTCGGVHVVTAANGVFTSGTAQRWTQESVDPSLRLTRLYCHMGQPWAVGFPGVVVRREPAGTWQVVLRRDESHPEETHVHEVRAVFNALELVDGRLRAYGRTVTGGVMHWEQRGNRWVEVPEASARVSYLPEGLCGAREVPSFTNRVRPAPLDLVGFRRPAPPSGYRYGSPSPFCAVDRVFQWLPVIDSYDEARGGVLGWEEGARWESVYIPLERPIGGVRVGSSMLLVTNGASLLWSGHQ